MNDVDSMPTKCHDCPYWEIAEKPYNCKDCKNACEVPKIIIGTTPTITYNFKVVSPPDFRAFDTLYGEE